MNLQDIRKVKNKAFSVDTDKIQDLFTRVSKLLVMSFITDKKLIHELVRFNKKGIDFDASAQEQL